MGEYCRNPNNPNNYHCRKLGKILTASHRTGRMKEWETGHHVGSLLYSEDNVTIIRTRR